jgi:uncharacterized protein YprB with RNaseH-like and TPR domain
MARLLGVDIETAPAIVYTWGLHDQNIGIEQVIQPSRVLCWSAKWFGEKKIHYADERSGKKKMLQEIRDLLEEADAVVGYNSDAFDLQKLNGEFIYHRISPCPPLTSIDLYRTIRGLGYISGKLAFIGPFLKIGAKVKHEGFSLWSACMKGDPKAWDRMRDYNKQDTELLEGLYEHIKPYIKNHPQLGPGCPVCQSKRSQARGVRRTKLTITERRQCLDCGSWYAGSRKAA